MGKTWTTALMTRLAMTRLAMTQLATARLAMTMLATALLAATLTGCAMTPWTSTGSGGGGYVLQHTAPDGSSCRVEASSRRELEAAEIEIGRGCTLKAHVKDISGTQAMAETIRALTDR